LTPRMSYNYRRCWLVLHNLSAHRMNDCLKQSRKFLEVLQSAKRLQ
jgi:dipeptidase